MNTWSLLISLMLALQRSYLIQNDPTPTPPQKGRPVQARVIANCVGWVQPYYLWLNKNTILIFRGDYNLVILDGLEVYHLDTGKHVPLDAFNRKWLENPISLPEKGFQESDSDKIGGAVLWPAVSPDGKWIAWWAYRAINSNAMAPGFQMTISLDGKHWAERPRSKPSVMRVIWSHTRRSWIGLTSSEKPVGLVYDVYTQRECSFDFSSQVTLPRVEYSFWSLVVQRPNGHLLMRLRKHV